MQIYRLTCGRILAVKYQTRSVEANNMELKVGAVQTESGNHDAAGNLAQLATELERR
jgi:hypothetical protein